jgi:hypothetical protein
LFGGKEKDSDSKNKASKQMVQEEAPIMEMPKILPPISRNKIESVIPVKRLPDGWVFRDELLAPWSTSLPAVLTIVPDTTVEVVYTDESRTTKDGIVLPIKRATVEFNYVTRLTIERITLGFVNIDYVYSTTNNSDSHYILESVVKKIKLKDTGFPQLTAEDVIKHKVLMEYGTPKEYDGVWHNYGDENSIFRVRKLDERNVKVEVDGLTIADKLNKAIEDVYSQQGIEYKKRLMMDGIDLATGMHNSVVCSEDIHRVTPEMLAQINESYAATTMFKAMSEACSVWPSNKVDEKFSSPITSSIPTLLLSGYFDPATPPSWATLAMVNMANAKHFIAPYSSHGVAYQTCANDLIAELVELGEVAELDDSCLTDQSSRGFFLNASSAQPLSNNLSIKVSP